MYYNNGQEQELGFDAFIAPDDFNRTAQPVDIYEVFKREYALNSQARYIYYYSDGNYPLTLTPSASEYYRYGYTQGGSEIVVDVALNAAPVTIFGETLTTKRWVIVYRVSTTVVFSLYFTVRYAKWLYAKNVYEIKNGAVSTQLSMIHLANINSITGAFSGAWSTGNSLIGTITAPETLLLGWWAGAFTGCLITKINSPNTKDIPYFHGVNQEGLAAITFNRALIQEFNFGASTWLGNNISERNAYTNLSRISVSPQNTGYASFDNCDIIYTKDLTTLYWVAPKTVRGLTLPDQLPQAQITALGTKLSANIMQGYPLCIGTQITDLTNLYLSNKSFSTIGVGVGNTVFSAENGMLRTATNLIKAGTSNTGDLIIPNVQTIEANCFLRCTGYTGNLTIPNTVTSIAAGVFSGLTNLTSLTLPVGFDTNVYNYFGFANFTAASLNTAIQNLASGTVGTPRTFYISKTSFDALNVAYPNAVSDAAARYINVKIGIVQDSSLKLWLDAGNTLSYPGSGTVWNDLSGNGNNGTLVNGVAYSTANGGVMSFDGVNDYVNLGNKFNLNTDITFSIWAKDQRNATGAYPGLISKGDGVSNSFILFIVKSDGNAILKVNNTYPCSGVVPNDGFLHNICFTKSGSTYTMYIDGIQKSQSTNINTPNNTSDFLIGKSNEQWKGSLNEPLIYNRALTQAEITQNFNATRSKYGI